MEDPHFSYNIFHGNTTRDLATQIQSTLKVPDGLPKAKGLVKTETVKKPLCDVGNTLTNVRKTAKSASEQPCKSNEARSMCSASEVKGLPDTNYHCDEVFSDEVDVWNWESSKMIDFDESLDPVPKAHEDNYGDIIPSEKDISMATIHKMVYLWEQYDIPQQSSWHFDELAPLPEKEIPLYEDELLTHVTELPVPDAVPLIPLTSF